MSNADQSLRGNAEGQAGARVALSMLQLALGAPFVSVFLERPSANCPDLSFAFLACDVITGRSLPERNSWISLGEFCVDPPLPAGSANHQAECGNHRNQQLP